MQTFLTLLISGLVIGGIYGLIALGYSLIYRASGLMSFAQGDMVTLGAYLGIFYYVWLGLPILVALVLTFITAFLFGMALERGVIRTLLKKNVIPIYIVLATIAVSYIIQNLAQAVFAQVLGVSKATVVAWENGTNTPGRSASRLLELIEAYPDVLLEAGIIEIDEGGGR